MKCVKCGSGTRMQVQAVISAPGELTHALSKRNLRRKDVYILGVLWETADYICTNLECQHVFDGYGNYVTRLKNENQELRAELDAKNAALENVRLLAARYRNEDWACHMLRFVEHAGIHASPLRSPVPSVPPGYQLVPVEPTHKMVREGDRNASPQRIYSAMLAAAPKPGDQT